MTVALRNKSKRGRIVSARLRSALQEALALVGHPDDELSVLFVNDEQVRVLNRRYFDRDRSTNVIAFPMGQGPAIEEVPRLLGDVVVSVDTARREGGEAGMPVEERILFLAIHGLLHLLGYEDEAGTTERRRMYRKNRAIFDKVRSRLQR